MHDGDVADSARMHARTYGRGLVLVLLTYLSYFIEHLMLQRVKSVDECCSCTPGSLALFQANLGCNVFYEDPEDTQEAMATWCT